MRRSQILGIAVAVTTAAAGIFAVSSPASADTILGPSGCVGRVDTPHKSSSVGGKINTHIITECNGTVPAATAEGQIQQLFIIWVPVATGSYTNFNVRRAQANVNMDCSNGHYRTAGLHKVTDTDGNSYVGVTTSGETDITC